MGASVAWRDDEEKPQAEPDLRRGYCEAYGCPLPGTQNMATNGEGCWLCVVHFRCYDPIEWAPVTQQIRRYRGLFLAIGAINKALLSVRRIEAERVAAEVRAKLAASDRLHRYAIAELPDLKARQYVTALLALVADECIEAAHKVMESQGVGIGNAGEDQSRVADHIIRDFERGLDTWVSVQPRNHIAGQRQRGKAAAAADWECVGSQDVEEMR